MKNNYWIWGIIGIVVIIALYFAFRGKSSTAIGTPTATDLPEGVTEAEVQTEIGWLKKLEKENIQKKATAEGRTFAAQLRLEAIWYVKQNKGLN